MALVVMAEREGGGAMGRGLGVIIAVLVVILLVVLLLPYVVA